MLTYSGEGPGENGKLTKMKTTSEIKDKDMVIFNLRDLKDRRLKRNPWSPNIAISLLDNHKLGDSERVFQNTATEGTTQ